MPKKPTKTDQIRKAAQKDPTKYQCILSGIISLVDTTAEIRGRLDETNDRIIDTNDRITDLSAVVDKKFDGHNIHHIAYEKNIKLWMYVISGLVVFGVVLNRIEFLISFISKFIGKF